MPTAPPRPTAPPAARPAAPPARPRSLILSFYGAFVRRLGGWVAVADLLAVMAEVGLDEQAVRSSVSRLKSRGWLIPERRDGAPGYALSDPARAALAAGDERIYGPGEPADLADGWLIVVFSVPEAQRADRHVLRSRLTWLGLGSDASGVWIGPYRLLPATRSMLESLRLHRYVDLFHADYAGFDDAARLVARCWDLDRLRSLYADFVAVQRPVLRAATRGTADVRAFTGYLTALDQWRGLPFLDPGLPRELLPGGWEGAAAAAVFAGLTDALAEPAYRHVRTVAGRNGSRR